MPTVLLGLFVALATWFVTFSNPSPSLDTSWQAGLYMALNDNIPFGTDVVFTYGPLGFLITAVDWYVGLATVAFIWLAVLHVAVSCALVWALRRSFGAIVATLVAIVVLALLLAIEVPFALAAIACFAVLAPERPRHLVEVMVVAGATFAAIEMLVKLSVGPPLFAMFLIALIGARARPWQLATYVGIFLGGVVGLWLATGNALGDLNDYALNGREIIVGYSEAMIVAGGTDLQQTGGLIAAIVGLVALITLAALAPSRDALARWCVVGVAGVAGFSLFKEGIVRFDTPHLSAYFATMVVFWVAIPWGDARRLLSIGGAAGILAVALTLQLYNDPGQAWARLTITDNFGRAITQTGKVFTPDERRITATYVGSLMQSAYALDQGMLREMEGRTVAIDPSEIAVAWAYGLDWSPLPVFQNYSAYTAKLDRLNASRVASPEGPDRILRGNVRATGMPLSRSIDRRFPGWDPPAQALATLCNFDVLSESSNWQLLGRIPDRCGEPTPAGSVEAAYGETVGVPEAAPGEVVFVRIDGAGVSGLESLRSLLYRASFRYAEVNEGKRYRLVPGTAADGLLLRGAPELTGRGPFAQAPQAETIALIGPSGDLRYDFFSMEVDPASGDME